MCGESYEHQHKTSDKTGSPPHVWGKLPPLINILDYKRITPTCVGKAMKSVARFVTSKDHPHMCGESYDFRTDQR